MAKQRRRAGQVKSAADDQHRSSDAVARLRKLVMKLREAIAVTNLNETYRKIQERAKKSERRRVYKLVKKLPSLAVRMDGTRNHGRAHLHCSVGKTSHAATVAIDTGEVIAGDLTTSERREVKTWVLKHQDALMDLWDTMQAGNPVEELICRIGAASV